MKQHVDRVSEWCYRGIWGMLTRWFRVPQMPPNLPARQAGSDADSKTVSTRAFKPSLGFLRYLKFQFWLVLLVLDVALLIGWLVLVVAVPWLGALLALPAFALAVLPNVVGYLAIHLRYDTTWYVMSDRSMRIRRGIWVIHETTITFENIQNVTVDQGPLQRWFGIANVRVDTAGGGGGEGQSGQQSAPWQASHQGLIEGIADAAEIRDLLLSRMKRSNAAGLGDESKPAGKPMGWTAEHRVVLVEIRDVIGSMVDARSP